MGAVVSWEHSCHGSCCVMRAVVSWELSCHGNSRVTGAVVVVVHMGVIVHNVTTGKLNQAVYL